MEVEDKEQIHPRKAQSLLWSLHQHQVGHLLPEDFMVLTGVDHIVIKVIQPLILQETVILQTPLTAAVIEAPAISLPGEVDPFGMAKLVAHEVQVSLTASSQSE